MLFQIIMAKHREIGQKYGQKNEQQLHASISFTLLWDGMRQDQDAAVGAEAVTVAEEAPPGSSFCCSTMACQALSRLCSVRNKQQTTGE